MKGFKYQITVKVLLCKYKKNGDKEYASVYFNSATKTVINSDEYMLDKSFQEFLYRTDNWINEGSGWIIESTESQYVNISIYSPLIGSTYIELRDKLKNPKKDLKTMNNDNKCFLWCHTRHLNPLKIRPERITKEDKKKKINDLYYEEIKFPVSKVIIAELKDKILFALMYSVMKII